MIDVAALRHRLGLSQSELASLLEVSIATVARWEAGNAASRGPARAMLAALNASSVAAGELKRLREGCLWGAPFRLWACVFALAAAGEQAV